MCTISKNDTGKKHHNIQMKSRRTTTVMFPIDVFLDTLAKNFVDFVDNIDSVDQNISMASTFRALMVARLLAKHSKTLLDSNAALKFYIVFYVSLQSNFKRRYLLDGWGAELFHKSFGRGPSGWFRFHLLKPSDSVYDKFKTALKLASLTVLDVEQRAGKYKPDDIPRGVGIRVAAFVGRSRFMSTFALTKNPNKQFLCTVCQTQSVRLEQTAPSSENIFLNYLELAAAAAASSAAPDDGDDGNESDSSSDDELLMSSVQATVALPPRPQSFRYWQQATCSPFLSLPPAEFCCTACELEYDDQIAKLFPVTAASASLLENSKISPQKSGLRRVAAAARTAARRNDSLRRHTREILRLAEKGDIRLFIPINLLKNVYTQILAALDIDHALLEAAACIAESPNLAAGKLLPGTCSNWRETHSLEFKNCIEKIKSGYHSDNKKRDFVEYIKRRALDIFV